jgi:predicted regulator of amino acid metabolism with ACT domain
MTNTKISFRQNTSRISKRESALRILLARRWRRNDADKIDDENFNRLQPEEQEAYTVEDSGRQFELAGSPSGKIRICLAQNPKLHPDVQLLLCKDAAITVRNSLTKNPSITEAVQLKLSRDKFDVRDSLVENPNLTEAIQIKIISKPKQSESIIEGMAKNPNLSMEVLKILLPKVSSTRFDDVCKNAKTLEKQKYLFDFAKTHDENKENHYYSWRRRLVSEFIDNTPMLPEMTEVVTNAMLESKDEHFVASILSKTEVSENILQKLYKKFKGGLLKKDDKEVVQVVAERTLDQALQKHLYENGYADYVVSNPKLSKPTAIAIVNSSDSNDIIRTICENYGKSQTDEGDVTTILDDDLARAILAKPNAYEKDRWHGSLSANVAGRGSQAVQKLLVDKLVAEQTNLSSVDKEKFEELAGQLRSNPSISLESEMFVLKHGDNSDRKYLAQRSKRPEIHNAILGSNDYQLLSGLIENESLSPEIKSRMLDSVDNINFLDDMSENAGLMPSDGHKVYDKALAIYNNSKENPTENENTKAYFESILSNLAEHTNDPTLMRKIVRTEDDRIWSHLAKNEHLPQELQKTLIGRESFERTRSNLAKRQDVVPEVQKILAKSADGSIKNQLYENDFVSADIKAYLKNITSIAKRFNWEGGYYSRPTTPEAEEQKTLLELNDPYINMNLAGVSDQKEVLEHIFATHNDAVLEALAGNKNADAETFKKIFELNKPDIDAKLFENPSVPVDIKELFFDRYAGTDRAQHYKTRLLEQGYASKEMQLKIFEGTKGKEVEEGSKRRLEDVFSKLLAIKNLDPEIQMQLVKYKGAFIRAKLATNPSLIQEVQSILLTDRGSSVRKLLAGNPKISEQTQMALAGDKINNVRMALVQNPSCVESVQKKLAIDNIKTMQGQDGSEEIIQHLLGNPKLAPSVQLIFAKSKNIEILRNLAGNPNLTKEVQFMLMKDKDTYVRNNLSENEQLHPEIRVRLKSKPPKDFDKNEFVARVHKNKYIFRILEKYMEDNGMAQLTSQDFKGKPIERYRQQPLVDAMFKENNGRPLTMEHIKKALEKMEAKEFYIYHGDFSKGIQSHEKFSNIPRHSFALLFKDLESDPQTLEFMKDVAPNMAHGHHGSMGGWGEMNMGWILWKDISKVIGKPAVLVEQVQSDWRGLMSKIRAMKDDVNHPQNYQAERMVEDWVERYGEESLPRIQKNLDELVKDYPEKLMAEFLSSSGVRGKTVYITGKETQRQLVGHDADKESTMLDTIYDRMPAAFGFKPAEDLQGFLKLERASFRVLVKNSGYRKLIQKTSAKLISGSK